MLKRLKKELKPTTPHLTFEISNTDTAIAWHENVLKRMGTYPQFLRQFSEIANYNNKTFYNLDSNIDNRAKSACERYADNFNNIKYKDKNSIIIYGDVGIGKTHLAVAVANRLLGKNIPVFFVNTINALDRIRDEMGVKDYTKATMKSCDLLILDDLGKEKRSEWTDQILYEIVNSRYMSKKPIIITTNYSAKELSNKLDKSVVSRLLEMSAFINMQGKDYRQ